jgi:hypothetical protein
LRRHLWVLLAFLTLSVLLTWPLAAQFTSHVPGDGIDDPALAWNLWWLKHALVDQPQNPFAANWIFWPVGINLAFYTLTILNGLLSIPLQVVIGLIPTYNILLLSSFALGGYGAYLLCCEFVRVPGQETRRRRVLLELAAFTGGAFYAFASAKMFYAALGQGNIASSQWVPFAALYIVRAGRAQGRWRDVVMAALFVALEAYAELTYASFLAIFAGVVLIWRLAGDWRRRATRPGTTDQERTEADGHRPATAGSVAVLARFALLAVLSGIAILPFVANMVPDLRAEGDFFGSGGGFADIFSADLAGYLMPTQLHPLLGNLARQIAGQAGFPINKGQQIYAGYVALGLVIAGLWTNRRALPRKTWQDRGRTGASTGWPGPWFWAAASVLFFLLTLGPSLRVAGHDLGLPLPFALVAQLPFFKGNRYPSRYSVMLLLSLAPLVAAGAAAVIGWLYRPTLKVRRLRPRAAYGVSLAVLALLLFEHLSAPLPLFDLRVPSLYQQVAQVPGDFSLLELPPGWRNGARILGKQDIVIMQELWNQTAHGKRLLGGNTSRNPEFKFQYFAEDPTLARLLAPTTAADVPQHTALTATLAATPVSAAEQDRARAWADFLKIRYVMVHRDKLPADTERTLVELLPVHLLAEDGMLALYEVEPGAALSTFDLSSTTGRLALAEGWSPPDTAAGAAGTTLSPALSAALSAPVWAERRTVRLLLPLGPKETQVNLYGWAPVPDQQVEITVDGRSVGRQPLAQDPDRLTFAIPADPERPPLSDVWLHFSELLPVDQVRAAAAPDGATGGPWAGLLARSASTETGDFAHLYVNGRDLAPNQRGYNLVALGPGLGQGNAEGESQAGTGWITASFDTHLDRAASARLAAWVAALPPGTTVMGAVRDEASLNLKPEAVQALQTLGVKGDLRGHFRWGHAFIGVKGAAPGSAQEAIGALQPVQAGLGMPASAPDVAAAFTEVTVGHQ